MKIRSQILMGGGIFILVTAGVFSNIRQQLAIDRSKIPSKVEESGGFQRWITNLKNKDLVIEADEFRLLEENEIYNTKWIKISSIEESGKLEEFNSNLESHRNVPRVVFSPSEREYIDYRDITKDGFLPNEVHFYGLKDDKIIDAKILDCSIKANCYFDRAYFLDNDLFVISEISRNIDKDDPNTVICSKDELCSYTFKIHVVDLVKNSRLIYESRPMELYLNKVIPEL